MVAEFQHGLIRLDVVLIALLLTFGALMFAAVWLRWGVPVRRRVYESIAVGGASMVAVALCTFASPSYDASEARMNSFSEADEAALRQIHEALHIEAHLAPEDPRRADLERQALTKLRRTMPAVRVDYVASTSIGLFEQTASHYGEIWYELGGRRTMSRLTTAEGVLESIYEVSHVAPPIENEDGFRGHPLAVPPRGAAFVFYVLWPIVTASGLFAVQRRLA
jgi:hypothetical protein